MAERRMFAKSIIGSARFLRMPPSSRLLYYDLGMYADDDGVVEAFSVMRQTNATEDDLRVLVTKGFVQVLNEDLVSVITDWKVNNFIRSDRYHESIYADLLLKFNGGIPSDNQVTTNGIPRLGKDRSGKDNKYPQIEETNNRKSDAIYDDEFDQLWELYPNKKDKKKAKQYYIRARKKGTTFEEVEQGIRSYTEYIKVTHSEKYMKYGSTFFSQESWQDDWTVAAPKSSKNDMSWMDEWGDDDDEK